MTVCDTPLRAGQVWEAVGTHAGLRVEIKSVGVRAKVQTLKHGGGSGGKNKRRLVDKAWHIQIPALRARYRLVEDADEQPTTTTGEDEVTMTLERSATDESAEPVNNYKAAAKAAFDRLSDEQRREILELRGSVPTGELCRTYSIGKATLGHVIAWGIQQHIQPSLREEVTVTDTAASTTAEAQDTEPVSASEAPSPDELIATAAPVFEPAAFAAPVSEQQYVEVFGMQTPISVTQYRVKLLVMQPVEVERTFTAASFAQAEQQARERIEFVSDILSIEKVR
jgi:hypothetical protein